MTGYDVILLEGSVDGSHLAATWQAIGRCLGACFTTKRMTRALRYVT